MQLARTNSLGVNGWDGSWQGAQLDNTIWLKNGEEQQQNTRLYRDRMIIIIISHLKVENARFRCPPTFTEPTERGMPWTHYNYAIKGVEQTKVK